MSGGIRFISAGAGSGKTYRLTQLLFEELQGGRVRPAGVLATTFTNRAATELRERVRSFLVEQGDYDGAVAIGAARIGTVNSVCGGLLQRFAFEAGLPTEQRVLDEARASQLLRETIDTVIAGHSLTELLQVARRLSLDSAPQDPLPPWQKALGRLVDQARANAIDADALRGAGGLNAANLLAHFPAPVAGDLDARLQQAIAAALPEVRTALEQTRQKNVGEYLEQLHAAERSLQDGTLTWALWNKLTAAAPAKLRTVAEPIIEAAGLYTAQDRKSVV